MQHCPVCGRELPDKANYCRDCGYDLNNPETIKIIPARSKSGLTIVKRATVHKSLSPADGHKRAVAAPRSRMAVLYYNVLSKLPMPVQGLIATILVRAGDPEPEGGLMALQKAEELQVVDWGWLPELTVIDALGVLSVAYAYNNARNSIPWAEVFFWLGLLLIFVPTTIRLLSPSASRFERIALLCAVGICFYLVNVMISPLYFSSFDAFLHWRTADDIARSGHLFSQNALLPVSPYYPGLQIVTNALSKLSGLSTFNAGITVLGVARTLTILSLFMLYEQLTISPRMAGIATILYMTNPQFLIFDAQFSYESLALPLAIFVLFAMARHETMKRNRQWIILAAWLVLGAIVVTHHMTSFVLEGLLILWAVTHALQRPAPAHKYWSSLAQIALLGLFLPLAWLSFPGNPGLQYLAPYFTNAFQELGQIVTGTSSARPLFVSYTGHPTPLWDRATTIASVALIMFSLPFGLLCLWQRYRSKALAWMLGIAALGYPVSHVFRLTNFGSEISDRSAAFLFIPIAAILAIFIAQFWPTRRLRWPHISLITSAIAVMLVGGIILGYGPPAQFLPGPYLVAADYRSIEPEGIQSAVWAASALGPNNRVATDRTNRLLMGTYGDQHIVTSLADNIDVTSVFLAPDVGPNEISILQKTRVRYLIVDLRLSTALPTLGFYFEEGEQGAFQHTTPTDPKLLTKFNSVPQINRIYDSGDIVIYDVGGLSIAPEKP